MTCSICQQESKYKCPACSARTCSLACSKQHKVSESCSGLPDPTKYLNREALFTDTSVNRDYRFLKRLERDIVVRKQDGESMPIFKRARYNQNRKDGKDNNVMERNGVKVHKVAQGMGRQKRNNSRWDPSIKQFCWTVEWVNADTQETMTVDKVNPVQSLLECFEKRHDKGGKDEKKNIEKEGVSEESQTEKKNDEHTEVTEEKKDPAPGSFYMKRVKSKNTSPILLEPSKPLSENLRDKSVVEYPTIYYTKEEIVVSDSDSDSDSASDSDPDSDSDSDDSGDSDDSDDDSGDDSDSAPEEESARQPEVPDLVKTLADSAVDDMAALEDAFEKAQEAEK